jgi:hypothetical protein
MNAGRIARVSGHFAACVGSLSGLSASEFGPTHRSARLGAACTSFISSFAEFGARKPLQRRRSLGRIAI